jgi:hypothetical protein
MAAKSLPHVSYLNECFDLNKETYELFWKERPPSHFVDQRICNAWNMRFAGKSAGSVTNYGYLCVQVNKQKHLAHRIIQKILTGEDYDGPFDHKDTIRSNNHPDNLRKATNIQNTTNTSRDVGKYKYRGVDKAEISPNYKTRLCVNMTTYHIGTWATPEEAHAAYCLAALHFKKEFANFGPNSCFPNFPLTLEFVSKARHHINKAEERMRRVNEA